MAFREELGDVSRLAGVHGIEREVVDDEEVDSDELAHLGVVAVIETRMLERLEHLVCDNGERRDAATTRDMADAMREEALADTDGADDGDVGALLDEPQRDELVEQLLVEGDARGLVPALELHLGVEVRTLRAERGSEAISTRSFVLQHQEQQVLMRHLLLSRERQPLGQRVEHAAELEPLERGPELG